MGFNGTTHATTLDSFPNVFHRAGKVFCAYKVVQAILTRMAQNVMNFIEGIFVKTRAIDTRKNISGSVLIFFPTANGVKLKFTMHTPSVF